MSARIGSTASATNAAVAPPHVLFFGSILKYLLVHGVPLGPNRLVTIRGRKSGLPRTTPLAVIEVSGRRWVWAPWGEVQWVRNLRAAGRATITTRRRKEQVTATELDATQRVEFFRDFLGPLARGIPGGAWFIRVVDGVDLNHPVEAARDRRVFELHPLPELESAMNQSAGRPSRTRPDPRERVSGQFLRLFNPLVRRLVAAGMPTGAPNILLTVRGRRSGKLRTTPVGMFELDGRRFVQASYGQAGWALNLRAAGRATVTVRSRRIPVPVQAVELAPDEAGAILRRALKPYRRSRLLRALLGPRWRPPAAVLRQLRIRVDDTPEEYLAEGRRHPLFELRPMPEAAG